ncbi:MAG: hypothetical protein M1831_004345 [Alyxoria varia]|nr:MAG: hypothetical protein M1831_004345 [Alyxoria varia]
MAPRTRARQRQTRLDFASLPASSPNKIEQPEAVRARAAAVTISPSPRKKRKTNNSFLPTPATSSQPKDGDGGDAANHVEIVQEQVSSPNARVTRSGFMGRGRHENKQPIVSPSTPKSSANVALINMFDDSESDASTSHSSERLEKSRTRKSRKVKTTPKRDDSTSTKKRPVLISDNDDDEEGDVKPPKQRRATNIESDDSDSDVIQTKPTRKAKVDLSTPKRNAQEEDDLREDLEFLRDSSPEKKRPRSFNQSAQKHTKLSALEKLKAKRAQVAQRRAGQDIESSENSSNSEVDEFDDEGIDQDDAFLQPQEDEEDFVIEDDDDPEARPEIPLEFRLRTMKPRELFKYAVEWMVQKKLNPAFDKQHEVYHIAFSRLNDFARGMGGSKFQSSAWTPKFTRALNARPELTENHVGTTSFLPAHCDACNRSNHPATFEVQFYGNPYDKNSLENYSDDEDDPIRETALPTSDIIYSVGKYCMRNARIAHAFVHWKFHLNEWVVDYLKDEGHSTADKVLEREEWSVRRRRDYALSVVDEMEEMDVIKRLYQDFKDEIESAQNAEVALLRQVHKAKCHVGAPHKPNPPYERCLCEGKICGLTPTRSDNPYRRKRSSDKSDDTRSTKRANTASEQTTDQTKSELLWLLSLLAWMQNSTANFQP